MAELSDQLLDPAHRPAVVANIAELIDAEVARTSGMSGLAIRSAYRVLQGVRPGAVRDAVDDLLPALSAQLNPYYQQSLATGRPLAEVLADDPRTVADGLLAVADARAKRTSRKAVKRAYRQVRGAAQRHVVAALPGLAAVVEAHLAPGGPGS